MKHLVFPAIWHKGVFSPISMSSWWYPKWWTMLYPIHPHLISLSNKCTYNETSPTQETHQLKLERRIQQPESQCHDKNFQQSSSNPNHVQRQVLLTGSESDRPVDPTRFTSNSNINIKSRPTKLIWPIDTPKITHTCYLRHQTCSISALFHLKYPPPFLHFFPFSSLNQLINGFIISISFSNFPTQLSIPNSQSKPLLRQSSLCS